MSLRRGKYGVEYDPRQEKREPSRFGWVVALAVVAVLVTLIWTLVKRGKPNREESRLAEVELRELPERLGDVPGGKEDEDSLTSQTFKAFQPLNAEIARRPPKLRNLLMRLEEAEKRCDIEMAVSTIETIRALPGSPAADIDDSLARRLGALNVRWLFDLRNAQWVKAVKVGRGGSASRIAAENGSTLASLARLNGGADRIGKIIIGQPIYVLNHPRFGLVIHRRTRTADLSLNGKFFTRYDLPYEVKTPVGAYELPESRRTFREGVGACFRYEDRLELEMLLPVGTSILVSEL